MAVEVRLVEVAVHVSVEVYTTDPDGTVKLVKRQQVHPFRMGAGDVALFPDVLAAYVADLQTKMNAGRAE